MAKKIVAILIFCLTPGFFSPAQETEKIQETVKVVNIEVPVRVFDKDRMVAGLEKKDFRLFVNGKEKEIYGFYQQEKNIVLNSESEMTPKKRLFTLIFNINNYRLDLTETIDFFFKRIFAAGDRLIVLTNNYFLTDRIIDNPEVEKENIKKIISFEMKEIRRIREIFRNKLRQMLGDTRTLMENLDEPEISRRFFIESFIKFFKEFKQNCFYLTSSQYVKLNNYLEQQQVEKWIFNFYEINSFYQPVFNSSLDGFLQDSGMYQEYQRELNVSDSQSEKELGNLFLNSGATVHTVYFHTQDLIQITSSDPDANMFRLKDQAVPSESENILTRMTKNTGGLMGFTNKTEDFFAKIPDYKDICYMLTFVPEEIELKNHLVEVKLNNQKYRLVYDNQERSNFITRLIDKENKEMPFIYLKNIQLAGYSLKFQLDIGPKENKQAENIQIRLKIILENGKILFDKRKIFPLSEKSNNIEIKLPALRHGNYDILIEATDLKSGKTDVQIKSINPRKNDI